MKTHRLFLLLSIAALLTTACTGKEDKAIEEAAYGYAQALADYSVDDAVPYASQRTAEVTLDYYRAIVANTDSSIIASNTPASITITKVERLTDSTADALYHKSSPLTQLDDTLHLVKEKGRWVVNDVLVIPAMLNRHRDSQRRTIPDSVIRQVKPVPTGNR